MLKPLLVLGLTAMGFQSPQDKTREPPAKVEAPREDALVLGDGKKLSGTLLDIRQDECVLRTPAGKVFVPRKDITAIERANEPGLGLFFKNSDNNTKTAEDWRTLARVCERMGAFPEERECARRLLKLAPEDPEAHALLGEAMLDGKWLPEKEVEGKLQQGYRVVDGKLTRKSVTAVVGKTGSEAGPKGNTGAAGKDRGTKEGKTGAQTIRALDHLAKVLEEKDAHSLWMILCRSGLRMAEIDGKSGRVDLKFSQDIIDKISQRKGDYRANMKAYLDKLGVPRDWAAANRKKIETFLKKNRSGIHLETRYYHILSTSTNEMTQELGQKMDIVTAQVYHKIFEFEEKISHKYILFFWKDRDEFMRNGGTPGVAAYYRPDTKDLVGYNLRADGIPMDPFQTLFHEGWHQYFDFYIPNAPRWFDEGFAEIISPTEVKEGKANRKNGYNPQRSSIVGQAAARGQLIPLRDLIKMSQEDFYDPGDRGIAYAQAWSFVYFLTTYTSSNRKTQDRVRNFYKDYFWELHRGTDPVEAVDIVFKDVKFETLEAAWIKAIPRQK